MGISGVMVAAILTVARIVSFTLVLYCQLSTGFAHLGENHSVKSHEKNS
jgi:hypothetical protein